VKNVPWPECVYVLNSGRLSRVKHIVEETIKRSEAVGSIVEEVIGEGHVVVGDGGGGW
jgi:hypothetical protein